MFERRRFLNSETGVVIFCNISYYTHFPGLDQTNPRSENKIRLYTLKYGYSAIIFFLPFVVDLNFFKKQILPGVNFINEEVRRTLKKKKKKNHLSQPLAISHFIISLRTPKRAPAKTIRPSSVSISI